MSKLSDIMDSPVIQDNPKAMALAFGMELMAASNEHVHNITRGIIEQQEQRIAELERQNRELAKWAALYWRIRGALTFEIEDLA